MDEMIKRLMDKLSAATERREAAVTARKAILDAVEAEKRADLTDEEDADFTARTAEVAAADEEIRALNERIEGLQAEEARAKAGREAAARVGAFQKPAGGATVTSEGLTYQKRGEYSYIRDLVRSQIHGDYEARERIARHANEFKLAPEFAEARAAALTTADGSAGNFVPPAWLMSQWIELARPGRPTANLIETQAVPGGTDQLNVPKVATGTGSPDIQNGEGTAVNDGSFSDTSIQIPIRTVAGQQTISQQTLDMSPLNFDEIIFRDLLADYAIKVDKQVLFGTGANNQVTGLRTQANTITVNAGSSDTAANVMRHIADAVQQVHATRYQSPEVIVMHPKRWAWLMVQTDSQGRPLVVPRAYSAYNNMGSGTLLAPQGPVGDLLGIPVVLDANVPTTEPDSQATPVNDSDPILVLRPSDYLLYESSIRARVLPEVKAQNLQVVVQVWGYLAFSAARYPGATAAVAKLVPPTF